MRRFIPIQFRGRKGGEAATCEGRVIERLEPKLVVVTVLLFLLVSLLFLVSAVLISSG